MAYVPDQVVAHDLPGVVDRPRCCGSCTLGSGSALERSISEPQEILTHALRSHVNADDIAAIVNAGDRAAVRRCGGMIERRDLLVTQHEPVAQRVDVSVPI